MVSRHTRYPAGPLLRVAPDLDVPDLPQEEVLHLSSARVAIAEYELLQHDFPELTSDALALANPSLLSLDRADRDEAVRSIIDDWLIANAAYVSKSQARQSVVNTEIHTDGKMAVAYRPRTYGRALVIPVHHAPRSGSVSERSTGPQRGLLDLKGAGVGPDRVPTHERQSNGLELLSTALSDFMIKMAIDAACARTAPSIWTAPVYAVLDLGFDVRGGAGPQDVAAAGMHVRRAHRRPISTLDNSGNSIHDSVSLEIEMLLRRYGMTTAGSVRRLHIQTEEGHVVMRIGDTPWPLTPDGIGVCLSLLNQVGPVSLDRPDVQYAREINWPPASAQLLDFGAVLVQPRFVYPLSSGKGVSLNRIQWPDAPEFVQPDPALRLPMDSWSRDALSRACLKLARQFRANEISRQELRARLDAPLDALVDRWLSESSSVSSCETAQEADAL